MPRALPVRASARLADVRAVALATGVALWVGVLFVVARDAYLGFRLGRFDLGNMVQAVWSTLEGRPLEMTYGATGEQITRLGVHVDPFLALLSPLWALWPSPLALALAQVAAVGLGALPVYWLARRHLASETLATLAALAYLANPWVAWNAVTAVHPVSFGMPLLLFAVWFLDTNRLGWFAACAVLAASTGELMALAVAALGLWHAFRPAGRWTGLAIGASGLAWTLVAVYVVVPAFSGEGSVYYGFYDDVGGSPQGVVRTLVHDPGAVLGALFEAHDVAYALWLAVPLLGLFALAPGLVAAALPQLLANVLSDFRSMTDPRYHTTAALLPFLVAGAVLGVTRLSRERRTLALAAVVVTSLLLTAVVGPWLRAVGLVPLGGRAELAPARVAALRAAVARVPEAAPVSVSNSVGAHLSARRTVYSVPVLGAAEWVVVDLADPWVVRAGSPILTRDPEQVARFVSRLRADRGWTTIVANDHVVVLQRRS
ncbi:MAG TPA: DUF2079 domain-containing protein [Gaiellaceae bacterium]|nr:DUF2079 domain-containing protein [Gaiellaceae bacterium]